MWVRDRPCGEKMKVRGKEKLNGYIEKFSVV